MGFLGVLVFTGFGGVLVFMEFWGFLFSWVFGFLGFHGFLGFFVYMGFLGFGVFLFSWGFGGFLVFMGFLGGLGFWVLGVFWFIMELRGFLVFMGFLGGLVSRQGFSLTRAPDEQQGKVNAETARDFAEKARDYAEQQQEEIFVTAIESRAQSEMSQAIMLLNHPSQSLRLRCKAVQHASMLAAAAGRPGLVASHLHSLVERVTLEEEFLYYKLPAGKGRTRTIEYHGRDLLAYGGDDGRVFIFNMSHMIVPDEHRRTELECDTSQRSIVFDLSWSPSGSTLAAGMGATNTVCIWQGSLGGGGGAWDLRASLKMTGATPECSGASWLNHSDVLSVAYSPTRDDLLAVASTNGALYLWDVAQRPPAVARAMRHCNMTHYARLEHGEDARRLGAAPPHTSVLAWLEDGRHLLAAGTGYALELWDTTLGALVVSRRIPDLPVIVSISATPRQTPGEYHVAVSGFVSRRSTADHRLYEYTLTQGPGGWELILLGLRPTGAAALKLVKSPNRDALMALEMGNSATKMMEFLPLGEGGQEPSHQDLLDRFQAEMTSSGMLVFAPSAGAWVIRDVRTDPWGPAIPAEMVIYDHGDGYNIDNYLDPSPATPVLSAALPDGAIFVAQKAVDMGNGGPRSFNLECEVPEMSGGEDDTETHLGPNAWQISRDGSKVAAAQNWNGRGAGICLWQYDLTNGYENTGNIYMEDGDEGMGFTINRMALSPDGNRLLVILKHNIVTTAWHSSSNVKARLYDISSWAPRLMYIIPYYWVKRSACNWTPDSKFLICSTSPQSSVFWYAEKPPGPNDLQLSHNEICSKPPPGIAAQELERHADGGAVYEVALNCVDQAKTACSVQFWDIHVDGSGEVNLASKTHVRPAMPLAPTSCLPGFCA